MDFQTHERRRDRRLRRRLLRMLFNARSHARGGLHGRAAADLLSTGGAAGDGIEDDDHLLALLRDLAAGGYATLADERTHPKRQRYGVDFVFAAITARGVSLVNESIPRDPDVEDDRDPEDA